MLAFGENTCTLISVCLKFLLVLRWDFKRRNYDISHMWFIVSDLVCWCWLPGLLLFLRNGKYKLSTTRNWICIPSFSFSVLKICLKILTEFLKTFLITVILNELKGYPLYTLLLYDPVSGNWLPFSKMKNMFLNTLISIQSYIFQRICTCSLIFIKQGTFI